jgi:hypothetical protein
MSTFSRMLNDPTSPHLARRNSEWWLASAALAQALMERWEREDSSDDEHEGGIEARLELEVSDGSRSAADPGSHPLRVRTIWGQGRECEIAWRVPG